MPVLHHVLNVGQDKISPLIAGDFFAKYILCLDKKELNENKTLLCLIKKTTNVNKGKLWLIMIYI